MTFRFKNQRAFTLVELLIVIVIIGILAAAFIPNLIGGPARARDGERKGDLQQLTTTLEFYYNDNASAYPSTSDCVANLGLDNYMTTVLDDPQGDAAGLGGLSCTGYEYLVTSNGYLLAAKLENSDDQSENVYSIADVLTNYAAGSTTSTNLASFATCESLGGCSADDAVYIVGR